MMTQDSTVWQYPTPSAADWERVPSHLREGLRRYVTEHIETGSFLRAVLLGDLIGAVHYGDAESLAGLPGLVSFLEEFAPAFSWGLPLYVDAWLSEGKR